MSDDPMKEIRSLQADIAHLQARILNSVYRSAWNRARLQKLSDEIDAKQARLRELIATRSAPHPDP
ncbi:MAG: hypothetical protein EA382_19085 [Spirochaetaceae bacterium]|nr:MAG: hypothetical protein EA382_19085 [Spirochaetaceae bacterium]